MFSFLRRDFTASGEEENYQSLAITRFPCFGFNSMFIVTSGVFTGLSDIVSLVYDYCKVVTEIIVFWLLNCG
jgi:hypothetical protein